MKKIFIIVTALILTSCSFRSAPSNFYRLEVESSYGERKEIAELGVGPIVVAPYLNRQQIVTQTSDYEFKLNEKERWIEPLASNIKSALIHGLENELQINALYSYPWLGAKPTLQLKVSIEEFHCKADSCLLSAAWSIIDHNGKKRNISMRRRFTKELKDPEITTMIHSMSELLRDLTKEIAESVIVADATTKDM